MFHVGGSLLFTNILIIIIIIIITIVVVVAEYTNTFILVHLCIKVGKRRQCYCNYAYCICCFV